MLTLLFTLLMIVVFGKIIMLAFKATWGITKIICSIIFLPVILICMAVGGILSIALPILIIVGIGTLFVSKE